MRVACRRVEVNRLKLPFEWYYWRRVLHLEYIRYIADNQISRNTNYRHVLLLTSKTYDVRLVLFRRLYFHGAQFHTQQFASMRKLTTLQCYNIASPAWRRQPLITNYSFTSEQVRKAVICAHNWPWTMTQSTQNTHAHTHKHTCPHERKYKYNTKTK